MNRITPTSQHSALSQRPYSSSLRERQVEQTRELIFQTLMEELAQDGFQEFNIPRLARRAGVSIRTIYRYFPTKEVLLDAFSEWADARVADLPALPAAPEDLADQIRTAFAAFDEHETVMLAQWATPAGREVRERGRRRRLEIRRIILKEVTDHLSAAEGRAALAVLSYLMSSRTWKAFREEFGMSGRESGRAVAWAVRTLVYDLRRRNEETAASEISAKERKE